MSKSLSFKLQEKIHEIYNSEEDKLKVGEHYILDRLKSSVQYKRTPQELLTKQIQIFFESIGVDISKKKKNTSLNNQLPYVKKAKEKQKESKNIGEDDQINDQIKKKMKIQTQTIEEQIEENIKHILGLDQLGGISEILQSIHDHIYLPLSSQYIFTKLNVKPPKGLMITGPAGSGKTALALGICKDIYQKFKVPFYYKTSTELIGGISGESEKNLRSLFKEAAQTAPSLIFIDEIDAIAGSREKASKEMERRIVSELLSSLDKLPPNVFIITATSRADYLEQAVRGRFDNEIVLKIPNDEQRHEILVKLTKNNPLHSEIDLLEFAKRTPGYVPADLTALIRKAGVVAVQRIVDEIGIRKTLESAGQKRLEKIRRTSKDLIEIEENDQDENNQEEKEQQKELEQSSSQQQQSTKIEEEDKNKNVEKDQQNNQQNIEEDQNQSESEDCNDESELSVNQKIIEQNQQKFYINKVDFEKALTLVQPTGKREGFTTIPEVKWEDIGGLDVLRSDLYNNIILPIQKPERFKMLGLNSPAGVLLYGPPGCGKTLLAKAVANSSRANFIAIKGPELLNKYVGESEKSVRALFARARASSPCVIFFDEIDAIVPKRGTDGNQVTERVVNSLLTELQGVEDRKQVYVIAATNRPDIIDPALLRPGRLDKLLYVPLPDQKDRLSILQASSRKMPINNQVNFEEISKKTKNYSGADLAGMVKEAALIALLKEKNEIDQEDLNESFTKSSPSLSQEDIYSYEKLQKNLLQQRQHITKV